jgi:hypothetical protein
VSPRPITRLDVIAEMDGAPFALAGILTAPFYE